jgi:hypothetical protein
LTTTLAVLINIPANASEAEGVHPFLASKYSLQVGVFSPSMNTTFSVNGSLGGQNTSIDFEQQLDLGETDDILAVEFNWRYGAKWSLRMQHFEGGRRHRAVLADDIQWGDITIQAGSSVSAGADLKMTRVFFGRSFDSKLRHDYGIGMGLHWLSTEAFIARDIIVSFAESRAVSASAPLPNIGTWYYYSPAEKWYVGGRLDWFSASVGDYSGRIINVAAGVNYQMFKHVGVGAKYQVFELSAEVRKSNWRGRVAVRYEGLYLYLSGNW